MKRLLALSLLISLVLASHMSGGESQDGRFQVVVIRSQDGAAHPGERTDWRAAVLAKDGTELFTVRKHVPYGSPFPGTALFEETGELILVDAFAGLVEFTGSSGALVRTWKPFGDDLPDHERILKCSTAGDRAAFAYSSPGVGGVRIAVTDRLGEILWTAAAEEPMASELVLSSDGEGVIISSYQMTEELRAATRLYSRDGRLLLSLPVLMRNADFDGRSGRWVIAGKNSVWLGTIGVSMPAQTWAAGGASDVVTDVVLADTGALVLVERVETGTGRLLFADPTLIHLKGAGDAVSLQIMRGTFERQSRIRAPRRSGESGEAVRESPEILISRE